MVNLETSWAARLRYRTTGLLSIAPTSEFFFATMTTTTATNRTNRRRTSTSTVLKATIPRCLRDGFNNKPLLLTSAFILAFTRHAEKNNSDSFKFQTSYTCRYACLLNRRAISRIPNSSRRSVYPEEIRHFVALLHEENHQ